MNRHENKTIVFTRHVSCDGDNNVSGHPKIFLEIKEGLEEVKCPYCSKHFVYEVEGV